tara:strand:- start:36 stop:2906 length:2871 start_codon:yes stop_codon:yes gene_type:complete
MGDGDDELSWLQKLGRVGSTDSTDSTDYSSNFTQGALSQPQRISNTNSVGGQFASGAAKEGGIAASTIGTSWLMDLAGTVNQLKHADFRGRKTYQPAKIHAVTGMPVSQVEKDYPIDFNTENWDRFEDIPGTTDFWAKKLGIPFEHTTPETVGRLVGGIFGMGAPLVPGTKAFVAGLRKFASTPSPMHGSKSSMRGNINYMDMPSFAEAFGDAADPGFFKASEGFRKGPSQFLVNPSENEIRTFFSRADMKDGGVRTTKDGDGNLYMWNAKEGTHKQFHIGVEDKFDKDMNWNQEYWNNHTERLYPEFEATEIAARNNPGVPALDTFDKRREWVQGKNDRKLKQRNQPIPNEMVNFLSDEPISSAGAVNRQGGGRAFAPTRTDRSRHGKKLASGSTVGAPPQIKNKKQLDAWRERRLESIEKGAQHADWYERNSKFIDTITAGNNTEATGFARAGSSVSNQTTPSQELMYTARGSNQIATGAPVKTGKMYNAMSPRFEEAMAGTGEGGLKTDPYALHKMVEWDKSQVTRPTNDVWMVREFEYPEGMESAGNAQHRWMDEQMEWLRDEANKRGLGGKTDWNYGTVQAAPWVYKKGMDEFAKAKNKLGDAQYYIERAGQDWWQQSPDYTAQVTREWTPGKTTEHLPEMVDTTPAVRDQYGDLLEGHVTDPKYGIDRVARGMGALTLPSERSIGRYEDLEGIQQLNPGYNTNMLVGKRYASGAAQEHGGTPGMDDSSAKLADAVASAHGLIGTQDQVARRYMTETAGSKGAPQSRAGAIEFLRDEPFSPAEIKALQDDAMAAGLDPPAKSTRGANSLVFAEEGAPERKEMNKVANALAEKYGARRRWSNADTDLYPVDSNFNAPSNWSAQPFIDRIKAGGDTVTEGFESVMRDIAPGMRTEVNQFAKANNMTEAQWYGTMMDILSKPNAIKNLEKAVKDGIVPVAFLGVIGFTESEQGS